MAWMPVAEAAARLGVSERTIWRRIKSEAIPSRSEAGRTLVDFDETSAGAETGAQLPSRSAEAAMDDEAIATLVAELGEFRAVSERAVKAAQRSRRAALGLAAMLVAALGTGLWYHFDTLSRLETGHVAALADLQQAHEQDLGVAKADVARAQTLAASNAAEVARVHQDRQEQRAIVAAIENSQEALRCAVDERIEELSTVLAQASRHDATGSTERAQLVKTVEELREAVHQKERAFYAAQQQSERIIAVLQRHAARSAGLAEGLQIHIGFQQQALARAQSELSELHTLLAEAPAAQSTLHEIALREQLRSSVGRSAGDETVGVDAGPVGAWSETVATVKRWCSQIRDRARTYADDAALARVD